MKSGTVRDVDQEFRHVGQAVDKHTFLLPLRRKAPDALIEALGDVEVAVWADREARRCLQLPVDDDTGLLLAFR